SGSASTDAAGAKSLTRTAGVLSVGTTTDSKPNAYRDNGKMTGFDIDLVEAIAKKLDLRVEYKSMEFSALLPAVANGQVDVATNAIAATVERQKTVDFAEGNVVGAIAVLTKKDSGITKEKSTVGGKRLGLVQGSIQEAYATKEFPDAQIVRFPDNNSGVAGLDSGRVDAFFIDAVVGADYVKQNSALTMPIYVWTLDLPAAIAVKKGNTKLLDAINKAQDTIFSDGTWKKLYEKYYEPTLPLPEQLPPYKNPQA
ncbi:MAG: amino acid ABC transporter substrate-binding protein, partial [Actinobacteria bacterium]|nr:amino acid ABC transporter substrate-binding protein [Actinomycetota bacterium]